MSRAAHADSSALALFVYSALLKLVFFAQSIVKKGQTPCTQRRWHMFPNLSNLHLEKVACKTAALVGGVPSPWANQGRQSPVYVQSGGGGGLSAEDRKLLEDAKNAKAQREQLFKDAKEAQTQREQLFKDATQSRLHRISNSKDIRNLKKQQEENKEGIERAAKAATTALKQVVEQSAVLSKWQRYFESRLDKIEDDLRTFSNATSSVGAGELDAEAYEELSKKLLPKLRKQMSSILTEEFQGRIDKFFKRTQEDISELQRASNGDRDRLLQMGVDFEIFKNIVAELEKASGSQKQRLEDINTVNKLRVDKVEMQIRSLITEITEAEEQLTKQGSLTAEEGEATKYSYSPYSETPPFQKIGNILKNNRKGLAHVAELIDSLYEILKIDPPDIQIKDPGDITTIVRDLVGEEMVNEVQKEEDARIAELSKDIVDGVLNETFAKVAEEEAEKARLAAEARKAELERIKHVREMLKDVSANPDEDKYKDSARPLGLKTSADI